MNQTQYLTEIELPIWADPQGNVVMEKSRDHCCIYFACWEDNVPTYSNYLGKITFINAWAVNSLDVEFYDIYPKEDWKYKSSITIVENSVWLSHVMIQRTKHYDNWTKWKDKSYKHYHFSGHDNYFDVIAEDFMVEKIALADEPKYARLLIGE